MIGKIASFKSDHPVTASQAVLSWIEKRLSDSRFKPALEKPSGILEKILSPVFARQFDASYSEGNTVHFVHPPVHVDQTQPMRDHALKIIERQILPLGEIPTLNAIAVLNDASQSFYAAFGGKFDDPTMRKWEPERLKAIAICDRIIANASGRVRWRIRSHLRHTHRGADPASAIFKHLTRTLTNLPFAGELRDTALFCSYEWQEMDDELFGPGSKPMEERKDEVHRRWNEAIAAFVRDYVARYPKPAQLLPALEKLYSDCERVGFTLKPFAPLHGFSRHDPKLGQALAIHLLRRKSSPLLYWWTSLISGARRFPDPWLEATTLQVLRSDSVWAVSSLLNLLSTAVAGPLPPSIIRALNRWAKSATGKMANLAISHVKHARGPEDVFWLAIAPHLTLRKLTAEQLCNLGDAVFTSLRYGDVKAPESFLLALISEFTRIPGLKFHRDEDFLALMSERHPKAVFGLYLDRVLLAAKGKLSLYEALPHDPDELTELPKYPGYPKLVRSLFKTVRSCPRKKRWALTRLLQAAVIRVSPLAIPHLLAWVRAAKTMEELEGIGSLFAFEGSLYLLRHPDLTLALLRRGRQLDPTKYPEWEYRLASTMGPQIHSFTNNKRDPEQEYVTAEVAKLTAAGNVVPELQSFYAAVLKHEQSWAIRGGGAVFDSDD